MASHRCHQSGEPVCVCPPAAGWMGHLELRAHKKRFPSFEFMQLMHLHCLHEKRSSKHNFLISYGFLPPLRLRLPLPSSPIILSMHSKDAAQIAVCVCVYVCSEGRGGGMAHLRPTSLSARKSPRVRSGGDVGWGSELCSTNSGTSINVMVSEGQVVSKTSVEQHVH